MNDTNKLALMLKRNTPEGFTRPQYKKWAKTLIAGKPLRILTNYERPVCFIPSSLFEDNGGMPEGTLIVTYAGNLFQAVAELDFTKSPNPFYLKQKGFPVPIGVLICKTIYSMFPHLNPLTEEDISTLQGASKKPRNTTKILRLSAPKTRKPRKPKETEKIEHEFKVEPPQGDASTEVPEIKPAVVTSEKTVYANRTPKQQKARRKSRKADGRRGKTSRSRKARTKK